MFKIYYDYLKIAIEKRNASRALIFVMVIFQLVVLPFNLACVQKLEIQNVCF